LGEVVRAVSASDGLKFAGSGRQIFHSSSRAFAPMNAPVPALTHTVIDDCATSGAVTGFWRMRDELCGLPAGGAVSVRRRLICLWRMRDGSRDLPAGRARMARGKLNFDGSSELPAAHVG
jgi:hypothetical protein